MGISRAIYVTATGQRVVIVRAFVKKTQQTPQRELDIARQREGNQMMKFSTLHKKWMKDPEEIFSPPKAPPPG